MRGAQSLKRWTAPSCFSLVHMNIYIYIYMCNQSYECNYIYIYIYTCIYIISRHTHMYIYIYIYLLHFRCIYTQSERIVYASPSTPSLLPMPISHSQPPISLSFCCCVRNCMVLANNIHIFMYVVMHVLTCTCIYIYIDIYK